MKAGSEMDFKWGGFWLVSLTFFVMSTGSFEGLAISKLCNKVASVSCELVGQLKYLDTFFYHYQMVSIQNSDP